MSKPLTPDEDLRGGDEADRASVQTEQNLAIAIRQAQSAPVLKATGLCRWCDEPLKAGLRFCEPDPLDPPDWACIREYEAHEKARSRNMSVTELEEPEAPEVPSDLLDDLRRGGLI